MKIFLFFNNYIMEKNIKKELIEKIKKYFRTKP